MPHESLYSELQRPGSFAESSVMLLLLLWCSLHNTVTILFTHNNMRLKYVRRSCLI